MNASFTPFWLRDAISGAAQAFERATGQWQAPVWLQQGLQHRLVLLHNHLLAQTPQARARLKPHAGRVLGLHWRSWSWRVAITPAGMFDMAADHARCDLQISLQAPCAWHLARSALLADKPAVHIQGDAQLAAAVQYLAEHLRWDAQADLARILPEPGAHAIVVAARALRDALRAFVQTLDAAHAHP